MPDTAPTFAAAAAIIAATECAALSAMLAEVQRFRTNMQAILDGLDAPAGYTCQPKLVGQSLMSNVDFAATSQLPGLIAQYQASQAAAAAQSLAPPPLPLATGVTGA
jgi:DNA-binding transcriptional regulator YbjK